MQESSVLLVKEIQNRGKIMELFLLQKLRWKQLQEILH